MTAQDYFAKKNRLFKIKKMQIFDFNDGLFLTKLELFEALAFATIVAVLTVWRQIAVVAGTLFGKEMAWGSVILACIGITLAKFTLAIAPDLSASFDVILKETNINYYLKNYFGGYKTGDVFPVIFTLFSS